MNEQMKEQLRKAGIVPVIKLEETEKAEDLAKPSGPAASTAPRLHSGQRERRR